MLLDRLATLFVEEAEEQIESAQQFDEPLMDERLWQENEHALRPAGEVQPVKNQAGLDRLAKELSGVVWIVDALLGTGSRGDPRPPLDMVIDELNRQPAPRLPRPGRRST